MDATSVSRCAASLVLRSFDGTIVGDALIDAEDLEKQGRHTWRLSTHGYAVRSATVANRKRTIYLHREICATPPGLVTDHINGNRLDNRRANLRTSTVSQNNANARDRPRQSEYRGVYWHRRASKWVSQISIDGHLRHLGVFDIPEAAAKAYDLQARAAWGPHARTNGFA